MPHYTAHLHPQVIPLSSINFPHLAVPEIQPRQSYNFHNNACPADGTGENNTCTAFKGCEVKSHVFDTLQVHNVMTMPHSSAYNPPPLPPNETGLAVD